jgi:expansin
MRNPSATDSPTFDRSTTPRVRRLTTTALLLVVVIPVVAACGIMPDTDYSGWGTFYTTNKNGNCSYGDTEPVLHAAMNRTDYEGSRACGAYIRVTGPKGSVTVKVVDQCPECAPGDVDLSPQAFDHIADRRDGRVRINWRLVSGPASMGNLQYHVKDGANPWWFAIQPRNHRNLVTTLEVQRSNGAWLTLPRYDYNYFVVESGLGSGPFTIRLTDVHGQQVVSSGIALRPQVVQTTSVQFAGR